MRLSSINTLADIALQSDSRNSAAPPSVSPSLSLSSQLDTAGSTNLTDPNNFISAITSARRSQMLMMATSAPMNVDQTLPNEFDGNAKHSFYLSALKHNEQRRLQSITNLERSASVSCQADIIPAITSSSITDASLASPFPVKSQVLPSAAVSSYSSTAQSQSSLAALAPSRRRKPNFAEKLHSVLSSNECRHAVTWLPSGRSFCITDQEEFVKKILPKFFREAKFESFSRRLKRWGFRKVYTTGLSQTIFSHDLFHRDRPDLCKEMNGREKTKSCMSIKANTAGNVPVSPASQATIQDQQCRKIMMAQQQAKLQAARQNMNSLQNDTFPSLPSSLPENIGAQSMINNALLARLAPNDSQTLWGRGPSTINQVKLQMARLNDDISRCEEQLVILHNLKELKERRRQLTGESVSSHGATHF